MNKIITSTSFTTKSDVTNLILKLKKCHKREKIIFFNLTTSQKHFSMENFVLKNKYLRCFWFVVREPEKYSSHFFFRIFKNCYFLFFTFKKMPNYTRRLKNKKRVAPPNQNFIIFSSFCLLSRLYYSFKNLNRFFYYYNIASLKKRLWDFITTDFFA